MTTLQSTAEEMAEAHAGTLGAIPAVLVPILLNLLMEGVRCWFRSGDVKAGARRLRMTHDRPAVVRASERHVRKTFSEHGRELSEEQVRMLAESLRFQGRRADDDRLGAAYEEAM